jgi:Raf kinase inhibitor-like YbhB/YbcL family protein
MSAIDSIKSAIGKALRPVRGSEDRLTIRKLNADASIPVRSPAFQPGGSMPPRFASDGENVSPPLSWGPVPEGTACLALLCEDPDAPTPSPFVHWVVISAPAMATEFPEGIPEGMSSLTQGKNSMKHVHYDGPAPPKGHGIHHYHFQLFALDAPIGLPAGSSRDELRDAIRGHVLAAGELVGCYER